MVVNLSKPPIPERSPQADLALSLSEEPLASALHAVIGETKDQAAQILSTQPEPEDSDTNPNFVKVYEGKRIKVSPDSPEQTLSTAGLNGCTAVLIFVEEDNGERTVCLSHFPPFMIGRHKGKISELLAGENLKGAHKKRVVLLVDAKRENHSADLEAHIKTFLGDDTEFELIPYKSKDRDPSQEGYGVFTVKIPSSKMGEASYSTWLNSNNL